MINLSSLRDKIVQILHSGSDQNERPFLKKNNESNISGLYVIGDLAGAPVIKFAMAHGFEVINHIAAEPDAIGQNEDILDVLIVGAGAAGLNATLQADEMNMNYLCIEKDKVANTIVNFPEGKWVYAEPDSKPPKGKLWLDGATKEDLLNRWKNIINDNGLKVNVEEELISAEKRDGIFNVRTSKNKYRAKRIVLATGQRGNPRKLKVKGENNKRVYHRLYSPKKYNNEDIIITGGGNSAAEAAITLSENNRVTFIVRNSEFSLVFKDNMRLLNKQIEKGMLSILFNSNIKEFSENEVIVQSGKDKDKQTINLPYDHAFVLIGAEIPRRFLKSIGIKMENEWQGSIIKTIFTACLALIGMSVFGGTFGGEPQIFSLSLSAIPSMAGAIIFLLSMSYLIYCAIKGDRFAWLGLSFIIVYTIYAIKSKLWPYGEWGYQAFSFFGKSWSFWYTVLYCIIMTIFGIKAMKRWGIDKKDRFQILRFISLLSFQWLFFFIIPEFIFKWAIQTHSIGDSLAGNPQFADQAWRAYGIIYSWPLFFYTFLYNPHIIWIIWGLLLTIVILPIFVLYFGKRYCSWICGCGGLAETLGDRWRHLSPKGKTSIKWETMGNYILLFAIAVLTIYLIKDMVEIISGTSKVTLGIYKLMVDVWLVGILPVTLYPFLGGKVWCRYWCPLAKLMQWESSIFTKSKISRFAIKSNDKCIGCYECSRNCQVGINVMNFALKQEEINNANSSCIGCGICVTICPMDVLTFKGSKKNESEIILIKLPDKAG